MWGRFPTCHVIFRLIWQVGNLPQWPPSCSFDPVMLTGMTANLEHYLDLLSVRTKLVASNIANADTPGYRTQDVDFQFELQSLVNGQQAQPMDASGLTMKPDGNNVDLDRESRLLAEDAYRFNMASTLLHGNLKTVLSAITEGK